MSPRSWLYSLRAALASLTKGGLMSIASVATVAVSLLVLSVVLIIALNLEFMAATIESQVEVRAYLCAQNDPNTACAGEATVLQKQQLLTQVRALPGVKEAAYVSKEDALVRLREQFQEQKDILEGLEENNPLRDSVEVKATETELVAALAGEIAKLPGVSNVDYGRETVEKLLKVTHAVRIGGMALVLLLLVATVLTISNTIRLAVYARRREISIMKLVGATDWFIRRPFMLEGIFLGGFGSLAAMLTTGYGYRWLAGFFYENVPFLPIVPPQAIVANLTLGLLLLGCVLGAVGSAVSLRRFLRV